MRLSLGLALLILMPAIDSLPNQASNTKSTSIIKRHGTGGGSGHGTSSSGHGAGSSDGSTSTDGAHRNDRERRKSAGDKITAMADGGIPLLVGVVIANGFAGMVF